MAVQIPSWEGAILGERGTHCKVSAVSCAKTAEPIDLPFGLWTRVGQKKQKFNRIRQVAAMCRHAKTHWCHLANTTEPSVCGGDVVLWQIILTNCLLPW